MLLRWRQFSDQSFTVLEKILFFLVLLFLPTQLGKHFWPSFALVLGQRIDYLSPTLYVTDILVILLFLIRVMRLFISTRIKNQAIVLSQNGGKLRIKGIILRYKLASCVLLLASLFLVFNISFSQSPIETVYGLVKLLEIGFLTYYTTNFLRKEPKIFLFPLTFGIISESVLATAQFFNQGSLNGFLYYLGERTFTSVTPGIANASINGQLVLRPYGTFSHPNVLAGYFVIGMTLLISNFKFQISNSQRVFIYSSLIIGTFGLLFTLSRVAILVWMVVIVFMFIRSFFKKIHNIPLIVHFAKSIKAKYPIRVYTAISKTELRKYTFYLILSTFTGCAFFVLLLSTPLLPRFSQLSLQDESVVVREQLMLDALRMIFAHPWFGVGIHNFLVALPYYDLNRGSIFSLQPVHNIFLLVGAETGFVGFWAVVSFVIWMYIRLIKSVETGFKPVSTMLLLSEVVIFGSFDHYFLTIQQGQLLLGLVLGVILYTVNIR